MGEQSKFNLRIIRCQQHVSWFGYKGRANFSSKLRAYWNILQVRIGRRQPSRRGSSLSECSMNAATVTANERRKLIYICRLQLRELPVIQNQSWNFMLRS